MRTVAVAASMALIVRYWDERGGLFWLGTALLALNVVGLLASRAADVETRAESEAQRLSDLLHVPGVAAAFAAGPRHWRQVSYLDEPMDPAAVDELAGFMWVEKDDGWTLAVEDEVKPYVDLDVEEARDPVLRVLEAHPAIGSAWHEDREVYRAMASRRITLEDFAALAARAVVAHHLEAVHRLDAPEER